MPPRVTTDPYDPRFPHGTTVGYSRRCRCDGCMLAQSRRKKAGDLGRARGAGPMMDKAPVVAHLRELLADPRVSKTGIARVADVHRGSLHFILTNPGPTCERGAGQRLLAVTADAAATHATMKGVTGGDVGVPVERPRDLVRQLQAHGWPIVDLARMLGYAPTVTSLPFLGRSQARMSTPKFARIQALHRQLQHRPGPCDKARAAARALGYYPPACYDDDGTLIPGVVRRMDVVADDARRGDKVKLDTERQAVLRLETLRLTLAGLPASEIGARLRIHGDSVSRLRTELKMRWAFDQEVNQVNPRPGQDWQLARCREAVAVYASGVAAADEVWVDLTAHLAQYRLGLDLAAAAAAQHGQAAAA